MELFTGNVSASRESNSSEQEEQSFELKQEVIHRAKKVVNDIQVQQLGGILDLMEEILSDPQKPFYITVDQLDETWAENSVRLRLLKGLLDTVREFRKVHNAKIIICLRIDLFEQLFKMTRAEAGFQEDKYRSLNLPLRWTKAQLTEILDQRISKLVRDRYTGYSPKLADLIPATLRFGRRAEVNTIDYMLDRTWGRPRDAIEFLNATILKSEGKPNISKEAILTAEGEYSRGCLRAIATEWYGHAPNLANAAIKLLENRPLQFKLKEMKKETIDEWSLRLCCTDSIEDGWFKNLAEKYQAGTITENEFRDETASIFYKTGIIGLKTSAHTQTNWASSESYSVSLAEIDDETSVSIHPGLWKVLGINPLA